MTGRSTLAEGSDPKPARGVPGPDPTEALVDAAPSPDAAASNGRVVHSEAPTGWRSPFSGGIRIHDRYFLREMVGPCFVSVAAFVMMLTLQQLYGVMDLLVTHRFPLSMLGAYLFFKLPTMVQWSLPVALLLGSSLAINRMVHDTELTPIRVAGLPLWRFLIPLAAVGVVCSVCSRILGEHISPGADHRAEALYRELTYQSAVSGLQPDTFFRSEDRIIYFRTCATPAPGQTRLGDVVIYQLPADSTERATHAPVHSRFWTALSADVRGQVWTLSDVIEHDLSPEGQISADHPVPPMRLDLHRNIQFFLTNQQKPQELTAAELISRIKADERLSLPAFVVLPLRYEYAFRMALPFGCLVFAIVSAPLTVRFARGGSMVGILVAFCVLFFFYDFLVIGQKLALSGAVPPELAAWLPDILFGALGIYMTLQEP
jgi:lipopolysaccharide export LptBFGC system permease protein LptF